MVSAPTASRMPADDARIAVASANAWALAGARAATVNVAGRCCCCAKLAQSPAANVPVPTTQIEVGDTIAGTYLTSRGTEGWVARLSTSLAASSSLIGWLDSSTWTIVGA